MRVLRKWLGAIARRVLPPRWCDTLSSPALLPSYCRRFAAEVERVRCFRDCPGLRDDEFWAAELRRLAHIIDKGLQRADFEPGHSASIYQSAREALARIQSKAMLNDPSVVWASNKICEFENGQPTQGTSRPDQEAAVPSCSYSALVDLVVGRSSVRSYSDRAVSDDEMRKVVWGLNWASTSCNRQTAKAVATNDPPLVRQCTETCQGATCFSEFVPCFLSFCADLRSYFVPNEIWLPMVDVALGTQNCCLAAHSLGLSLTLLSWAQASDEEERRLRKLLGIPAHYRIVVNAAMGYPGRSVPPPARKSLATTLVLRRGVAESASLDNRFDGDLSSHNSHGIRVHPRMRLVPGHSGGAVVQDNQGEFVVVMDRIDKSCYAGMEKGGISDKRDNLLSCCLCKATGRAN